MRTLVSRAESADVDESQDSNNYSDELMPVVKKKALIIPHRFNLCIRREAGSQSLRLFVRDRKGVYRRFKYLSLVTFPSIRGQFYM